MSSFTVLTLVFLCVSWMTPTEAYTPRINCTETGAFKITDPVKQCIPRPTSVTSTSRPLLRADPGGNDTITEPTTSSSVTNGTTVTTSAPGATLPCQFYICYYYPRFNRWVLSTRTCRQPTDTNFIADFDDTLKKCTVRPKSP